MSRVGSGNRWWLRWGPVALGCAIAAYFGMHAAWGERGLGAVRQLQADTARHQERLAVLNEERTALQRRVDLIAGPEVDGDLLGEIAARRFGWVHEDDIVILLPKRPN